MIWIVFIATLGISFWASSRVRSQVRRYNTVATWSGLTGAQAARRILNEEGLQGVDITLSPGELSDHYDPSTRTLALSEAVFHGNSLSAVGVAAHEAGHAIQHAQAYQPLMWRMLAVRTTSTASWVLMIDPLVLGLLGKLILGLTIAVICLAILMAFNLVTLPVEFDASRRAKTALVNSRIIAPGPEADGVSAVLNAAGLTYVASFLSSLAWFLLRLVELLGLTSNDD
jgi:Zn-dependent membrane protease YugP